MAAYRSTADATAFADAVSGFLRAFTEPGSFDGLVRSDAERSALADRVYASVHGRAAADPPALETTWPVAVLRIARPR